MATRKRATKKKGSKKKSKSKFKTNFGKAVSRDVERREQAKQSYGYLKLPKGVPMFNPEPKSRVKMDMMPYVVSDPNHPDKYEDEGIAVPGELWYKRPFSIHRNIGIDNDSFVCLKSVGKPCPVCEYREKRIREGASYKDDDIKQLKASTRNLYVVIPVRTKGFDEVPHIWDMSQYLFQNLLDEELKEDEEYWAFPDLENGKTLRVRFDEGKAFGNSFPEASRIDFYDRKTPYDESILDDIPVLDELLEIFSYEELEAKFLEIDDEDMADEEVYEEPPTRRSKSAQPEEEEEFEDEEFEDEEFEEEEDWEEEEPEEEFEEPEEEEEFEDEEFEDDWEEDEDWEEEEPEEDPEPAPKRTRKTKPKPKKKSKAKTKSKRKK